MKWFLVFLAGMLLPASLCAQDEDAVLEGTVVDKVTRQRLVGVNLRIVESGNARITDANGYFVFDALKAGRYTLHISYLGYVTMILPDVSVIRQKAVVMEIALEEDQKVLETVEVQSFRYENNSMKPISTFSFGRDEISLNPGAQGDIFRAIGMLPGVTSSGGIYSAIAVRGQGVRDNVYMVDDIPLTEVGHLEGNSFFNDPNGGRFSIFAPRVIESAVFQGAAFGTEYGRRSASYLGLSIKEGHKGSPVFDGQVDLLGANLNYDGPSGIGKTTLFASARYQNFYPLIHLIGLQNLGLPAYGDYLLKTSTTLHPRHKLNALLMVCPESFVRNMENLYQDKALNLLYLPHFRRNKIVASLQLHSLTGQRSLWKNILYYTRYSSDVEVGKAYPSPGPNGMLASQDFVWRHPLQTQTYREDKWGLRSVFETSLWKKDRLIMGVEADVLSLINRRELLQNDTNFVFRRSPFIPNGQHYQVITPDLISARMQDHAPNLSAFVNYYFHPIPHLSGQIGLRHDYTGFANQAAWAPRANISYHLNDNQSLSLGWGLFFQDPVYADIADMPAGSTLGMERAIHYILSYKLYLRSDLKVMAEAWYKDFDQLVVSPLSGSVFKNNQGTGHGRGLDLSITKRLTRRWHGICSYSYMEVKRNDHDGLGEYDFTFSQPHQFSMMLSYKLNEHWSWAGKYRYASGRPTDAYLIHANILDNPAHFLYGMELIGRNRDRLPDFSSLDLRVNYAFSWKKIKCITFVDVVNVLNRQIANSQSFNHLYGTTYYDGLAIFPTGGLKFEF